MEVELFFWRGCPSYPEAHRMLEDALAGRGVHVQLREVTTDEQAAELAFPGSPTIRVDGRDIDPTGADAPPSLSCRIYHLPDGRVSPLPAPEQLEAALG